MVPRLIHSDYAKTSPIHTGEGDGTPLQYSCLENPTDGGDWRAAVHGVAKSRTQLSDLAAAVPYTVIGEECILDSKHLSFYFPISLLLLTSKYCLLPNQSFLE